VPDRYAKFEPVAILSAGWALLLAYAYPGTLTFDSIDELIQARAGIYRDDHPPVVAALWRLVEHVVAGPFGMLALQSLAFVVGLYLIFRRTFTPRGAALAATLLLLFPPVFAPLTAIWKDSLMAGFLVLGIGALLTESRRWRVVGAVALAVATAMRFNAAAATLAPLVLLFSWGLVGWRRYAVATTVWLATVVAAFGVNSALADRQAYGWHTTLAIYDIVGTLAHVDEAIPDAKLVELLDGSKLLVTRDIQATARTIYDPRNYLTPVTDPQHAFWHFSLRNDEPVTEAFRTAMSRTWTFLVASYPRAYLAHRFATMEKVVDSDTGTPWRGAAQRELRAQMGLANGANAGQMAVYRKLVKFERSTHLFSPWIYLLVALILLGIAFQRDVLALLMSGLMYEGTLLVFAASRDYRYSHWLVTACCIAVVTLTARRARAKVRA